MTDSQDSNDLSAQMNSLGTHLEDMALVIDHRLTSMEGQFEWFQEDFNAGIQLLKSQHEGMRPFLQAKFSPQDPSRH